MEQAATEVEVEEAGVLQVPDQALSTEETASTPVPRVVHVPQPEVALASTDDAPALTETVLAPQGEASYSP
ncbi:unnamed protein product, partial [Ilex paraguariensis]